MKIRYLLIALGVTLTATTLMGEPDTSRYTCDSWEVFSSPAVRCDKSGNCEKFIEIRRICTDSNYGSDIVKRD